MTANAPVCWQRLLAEQMAHAASRRSLLGAAVCKRPCVIALLHPLPAGVAPAQAGWVVAVCACMWFVMVALSYQVATVWLCAGVALKSSCPAVLLHRSCSAKCLGTKQETSKCMGCK
jgi:hypothetical protein